MFILFLVEIYIEIIHGKMKTTKQTMFFFYFIFAYLYVEVNPIPQDINMCFVENNALLIVGGSILHCFQKKDNVL